MSYKQNLHIHSVYCDGKNTPREMVRAAMEKGFDSLGFSGHAPMTYSDYGIPFEKLDAYKREIDGLKEEYKGEFPIFLGLEVDMYSGVDLTGYDYLIGAMHYCKMGGEIVDIDLSAATLKGMIDTYFGGDGMAFAKRYYEEFSQLPEYGKFDIVGHLDIITKNIDTVPFVDVESKEYLGYAFETIRALKGNVPLFEINSGAMARGYRCTPYPHVELIKEFKRQGFGAVITSDCHMAEKLDCGFDLAEELLKACGFREKYILTEDGFKAVGL